LRLRSSDKAAFGMDRHLRADLNRMSPKPLLPAPARMIQASVTEGSVCFLR
jgi:hypothetical protein